MTTIRLIAAGVPLLFGLLAVGGCLYVQQPKFGKLPEGDRLARISRSSNAVDGSFRNQVPFGEVLRKSKAALWLEFLLTPREKTVPPSPIPVVKTDLKSLDRARDMVVWLGHSSYFVQLGGRTMLIDPVMSDHAAPVSFSTRAFPGSNPYTPDDMPDIDYLLISHDHWDHLDYATVTALLPKVRHVVTGLGVGEHLEEWGFPAGMVHEADWDESLSLDEGVAIHFLTARHFSGRMFTRNRTLWGGFAVETPTRRIFYSGDSGYGPHFAEIGARFGGFDLVLLDSGQYNEDWKNVHMMPEEAAQAALDLRAGAALPGHNGKFSISYHSWDDPYRRFAEASQGRPFRMVTPRIGEAVDLADRGQVFSRWWNRMG